MSDQEDVELHVIEKSPPLEQALTRLQERLQQAMDYIKYHATPEWPGLTIEMEVPDYDTIVRVLGAIKWALDDLRTHVTVSFNGSDAAGYGYVLVFEVQ